MLKILLTKAIDINQEIIKSIKLGFPDTTPWNIQHAKNFVEQPQNILLLAYYKEKLVGYLTAIEIDKMSSSKEIFLYEIEVSPKFQRKKVASNLLERLIEIAKEKEIEEIFVLTESDNYPAMEFYKNTGGEMTNQGKEVMFTYFINQK